MYDVHYFTYIYTNGMYGIAILKALIDSININIDDILA